MKKKSKYFSKCMMFLLSIVVSFSFLVNVCYAEEETLYMVNKDEDYTIEALIKKYNIVTLGHNQVNGNVTSYEEGTPYGGVYGIAHVVGPMLVQGNLGGTEVHHSQYSGGISTYIQGEIKAGGTVQAADGVLSPLYLGSVNESKFTVFPWGTFMGYQYYTANQVFFVDNYIDFDRLYESVNEEQSRISKGEVVVSDENGDIYLEVGGTYTIESLDNVRTIIFNDFDKNQDQTTTITITDSGDDTGKVLMPQLKQNNESGLSNLSTSDVYNDDPYKGNIVWSIDGAEYLEFSDAPFVGHVIAPNTDIYIFLLQILQVV